MSNFYVMVHSRPCHQDKCSGKAVFIYFIPKTRAFLAISLMYQDPHTGLCSSVRMPDCTALGSNSWLTLSLLWFQDWLRGSWTLFVKWVLTDGGGHNGGRRTCLPPTPLAQLHSAGRLKPRGAEDPGLKSGQSVHIILMAGSQKGIEKSFQMVSTNSLNSKPSFHLLKNISETTVWKHMGNVVWPCPGHQSPWVCDVLRSLTTIWLPSCYSLSNLCMPRSPTQHRTGMSN